MMIFMSIDRVNKRDNIGNDKRNNNDVIGMYKIRIEWIDRNGSEAIQYHVIR